jgi:hypothetical protein
VLAIDGKLTAEPTIDPLCIDDERCALTGPAGCDIRTMAITIRIEIDDGMIDRQTLCAMNSRSIGSAYAGASFAVRKRHRVEHQPPALNIHLKADSRV